MPRGLRRARAGGARLGVSGRQDFSPPSFAVAEAKGEDLRVFCDMDSFFVLFFLGKGRKLKWVEGESWKADPWVSQRG